MSEQILPQPDRIPDEDPNELDPELVNSPNDDDEDEEGLRDYAPWLEAIGPEDMDRDLVMEELEDYGFEQMDEDDFVSNPTQESDMPDWTDSGDSNERQDTVERIDELSEHEDWERPTEDEATNDLSAWDASYRRAEDAVSTRCWSL